MSGRMGFFAKLLRISEAIHDSGKSDGGIPVGRDEGHCPGEPCWCLRCACDLAVLLNTKALTARIQVLERFFSRKERARLFRSWVGSASMWVKVAGFVPIAIVALGSKASRRVATSFGETRLTRRMISTELIICMWNLLRSEPSRTKQQWVI